jgi:hypothetical protein
MRVNYKLPMKNYKIKLLIIIIEKLKLSIKLF